MQDIISEVHKFLSSSVDPLQERFLFQGRPSEEALKDSPLILILGNHSSGKSSFVNYFAGQSIQLTGMAPTDDDFTVLKYGGAENSRPGSSVVSNPSFGLEGLSQFGPKFLSHLHLKTLPNPRLEKVTLVDTPGMIDSADASASRGYDFQSVVRWFAERADLIMLFFDPERPGTTAETLEVYTNALSDFDHKLQVVYNKVDQFNRLSDFARCYGNLCWNLGKVMKTKDLPQIYAMFVPQGDESNSSLDLEEFVEARELLIRKMENTALQRVDNILTDVSIYLDRLVLHADILELVRSWRSRLTRQILLISLFIAGGSGAWFWFMSQYEESLKYAGVAGSIFVSVFIGMSLRNLLVRRRLNWIDRHPVEVFEQYGTTHRVRNERYQHLQAQWNLIFKYSMRALRDLANQGLPKFKAKERKAIEQWRTLRLPQLRTVVHQRENEVLNQALEEAMSFTEAEADALLDDSVPSSMHSSSAVQKSPNAEQNEHLVSGQVNHDQGLT